MSPKTEIINPLDYLGWDDLVLATEGYSFFHSSNWARVLHETYGYRPVYLTAMDAGKIVASLPCMEIKSLLTGARAVSLPFTDYCEAIVAPGSEHTAQSLFDELMGYGKQAGWRSIEIRCGNRLSEEVPPFAVHYGHVVDVARDAEELLSGLRESTRRNIKKAINEGVRVELSDSMESLRTFYRLNCLTRREHGLPPQPFRFFEKLHEHVLSQGRGFVALSSIRNESIAGAVFLHFGGTAIYKYGASDKSYQHLRANNLVMWEAIRWCSENGVRNLCLGRTEPEHDGLLQFKRGWGARERRVHYYKYDVRSAWFVSERPKALGGHKKIIHRVPIPLLRLAGTVLYRHIG
ncbi:MAG: GNAT family N-acetyltransferase [Nitrospirota bacterium]